MNPATASVKSNFFIWRKRRLGKKSYSESPNSLGHVKGTPLGGLFSVRISGSQGISGERRTRGGGDILLLAQKLRGVLLVKKCFSF